MSLYLPVGGTGREFKRVPPGSHIGICTMVVDCGLQPGSAQFPSPKRKLRVQFEVPEERIEYDRDGQKVEGPMVIGTWYTASMNEKATLRKHLEGWRGKAFTKEEAESFDVASILGKACMLTVIEVERGGNTYSNIAAIGKLPKGVPAPEPENHPVYYDATSSLQEFAALPKWLQEKIGSQVTPDAMTSDKNMALGEPFIDDDIPF